MGRAFFRPLLSPPDGVRLMTIPELQAKYPNRVIAVFPECTTSNGRGILPFSPSLLSVPRDTKVFPVNMRYTAADITTPIPNAFLTFFWNLCSKPTHAIRIRIAEAAYNLSVLENGDRSSASPPPEGAGRRNGYNTNYLDDMDGIASDATTLVEGDDNEDSPTRLSREERRFLDQVGEALARLGRVKRVGLGVKEKIGFLKTWNNGKRYR